MFCFNIAHKVCAPPLFQALIIYAAAIIMQAKRITNIIPEGVLSHSKNVPKSGMTATTSPTTCVSRTGLGSAESLLSPFVMK